MSFHVDRDESAEMHEINMTPLVDVLLVLLVVFMLTMPVIKQVIPINLPQASAHAVAAQTTPVRLSVDAEGEYFWNTQPVSASVLAELLQQHVTNHATASIELHADKNVRYDAVAQVFALAKRLGVQKLVVATQQGKAA
jgi:biopolymer transport protein ExbD